jgi:maltose O-acetyltransferase
MTDTTKTEWQRMLDGENYRASDPALLEARRKARQWCGLYNATSPRDMPARDAMLAAFLGSAGRNTWIEPPFQCDYGCHIHLGDGVYFNYNVVILDCAHVRIGAATKLGPCVQIYTACHPLDPVQRRAAVEFARPVTIGENVWIGGGAILCPGVTIGDNAVIGAGSVVTKDIPANVVAVGNPCRPLNRAAEGRR